MARRSKKKQAIDLKMYRHFAIATVAITAALAIFSDGGNRDAMIDGAAQAAEAVEEAELSGITLTEQPKRSAASANYSDPNSGSTASSGPSFSQSSLRTGDTPAWVSRLHLLGYTLKEFQALPRDKQESLLKMLRANGTDADEETMIRNVSLDSLERSGGGTGADM